MTTFLGETNSRMLAMLIETGEASLTPAAIVLSFL